MVRKVGGARYIPYARGRPAKPPTPLSSDTESLAEQTKPFREPVLLHQSTAEPFSKARSWAPSVLRLQSPICPTTMQVSMPPGRVWVPSKEANIEHASHCLHALANFSSSSERYERLTYRFARNACCIPPHHHHQFTIVPLSTRSKTIWFSLD
jgi:hypothetical protein